MKPIPIFYKRKLYPSLYALASKHRICQQTVMRRLRCEWTLEEALSKTKRRAVRPAHGTSERQFSPPVKPGRPGHPITVGGVDYPSRKALAAAHRVNYRTFTNRVNAGESVEDALRPAAKYEKRVRV